MSEYFGKGGILSPVDERDYKWENMLGGAVPFNWNLGYDVKCDISLKDQGSSGSCGGQATSYYGEVLEYKSTKTREERSARFIYAQASLGLPGGGTYLRDNFNIATKQGWAEESVLTSYSNGLPPDEAFMNIKTDITDIVRANASKSKALSYATVDPKNIDSVAQAIANNYGAVLLIKGTNNGTWLSKFPAVTKPGDVTWGHFLYACGAELIGGKKYIKVRNSWGNIGDSGYQWISEDFFTNGYIYEVRTMIFNDKPAKFQFTKNLNIGMRNGDVLNLQYRLVDEGFATFEPTGFFGAQTLKAVINYQKAKGIKPAVGYVGELTRAELNK